MDECKKLEKHLSLLRDEYAKLQSKLAEYERKYQNLAATLAADSNNLEEADDIVEKSFVNRLLRRVADLFEKDLYSDITIHLDGHQVRAHRFVLSVRSDDWGVPDLSSADRLEFVDMSYNIGINLLKWVYTDRLDPKMGDGFIVDLMKAGQRFKLNDLVGKCESVLVGRLDVKNCINFFQTADNLKLDNLRDKCSLLITTRWDEFTGNDFNAISAPLLYKMLKSRCSFPLHSAVKLQREDVAFLYLIEYGTQLPQKINENDEDGKSPLNLALQLKHCPLAKTLVDYGADLNACNSDGNYLLLEFVEQGNDFASQFLIENHCNVNVMDRKTGRNALHLMSCKSSSLDDNAAIKVAKLLFDAGVDVNALDYDKNSCLHLMIKSSNRNLFGFVLETMKSLFNLNILDKDGKCPLWYALCSSQFEMAQCLIDQGANLNLINVESGNSLLHNCLDSNLIDAAEFLLENGISTSAINKKGESVLHLACRQGMTPLVQTLLENDVDPNLTTKTDSDIDKQTALHLAIDFKHLDVLRVLLNHDHKIQLNLESRNSSNDTPLSLAVKNSLFDFAEELVNHGANVNAENEQAIPLLHDMLMTGKEEAALFLIKSGADIDKKLDDNFTPLFLAIKNRFTNVVRSLCNKKCKLNDLDSENNCPLWLALRKNDEMISEILVENGCDINFWRAENESSCFQTLLHKAIDENDEFAACFLIRHGCDHSSPRRPNPDIPVKEQPDEALDKQTPLHLAACWGLEKVVEQLIKSGADVNAQDRDGKTPVHVAIANQHLTILDALLKSPKINLTIKDRKGLTPFATAMNVKCNRGADLLRNRDPKIVLQIDNKGYNFLHTAVKKGDLESVLFLLSIQMDVCHPINDSEGLTPLHLAVESGHEMIVRNLILAGADLNAVTKNTKQTSLHLACASDKPKICEILLENGINFDAVDHNANNALHLAVERSSLQCARMLLNHSAINPEAVNFKGQNPLHILACHGKDNAAAIFNVFMEAKPDYALDVRDVEGNTPFLLAYMNGNFSLCKAALAAGACLAVVNNRFESIFNFPTPTKQLLFRILDQLVVEPKWAEGDCCSECGVKFSLTVRKHHCRHCGRLLCSKCSEQTMPILKYEINKPVRLCQICFDVLSMNATPS